jgi:hypothetical protein
MEITPMFFEQFLVAAGFAACLVALFATVRPLKRVDPFWI